MLLAPKLKVGFYKMPLNIKAKPEKWKTSDWSYQAFVVGGSVVYSTNKNSFSNNVTVPEIDSLDCVNDKSFTPCEHDFAVIEVYLTMHNTPGTTYKPPANSPLCKDPSAY